MVEMVCKCRKTKINFVKLQRSDFPKEWEQPCCLKQQQHEQLVEAEKQPSEQQPIMSEKKKKKHKKRELNNGTSEDTDVSDL